LFYTFLYTKPSEPGDASAEAAADVDIQFLLYKFAYMVSDFPEIKEVDINPYGVDSKGGAVLDAKVILDENVIGKKIKQTGPRNSVNCLIPSQMIP